jgi:hypothetical protein
VGGGQTHAVVAAEGTLFVAAGSKVVAVDTGTLRPVRSWTMDAPVSGLGAGPRGVYVAVPGRVTIIDPATGRQTASIPSPAAGGTAYVDVVAAT